MGSAVGFAMAGTADAQVATVQLPTVDVGADALQRGYQTNIPSLSRYTQPLNDTPRSTPSASSSAST